LAGTGSTNSSKMIDLARVLVFIAAMGIIALGFLAGLTAIGVGILSGGTDTLVLVTFGVSLLTLAGGLGSALALQARQAIHRRPSSAFRPRLVGLLVLLFLLAVALGQMMLSLDLVPVVTFPLLHVAAAALPSLIILALVGRGLPGATRWRDLILQFASGAFVATPLAFALEAIILLSLLVAALVSLALRPGGQELLGTMATYLQDPAWLQSPADLAPALTSPAILSAALLVVAGIIPFVEETVKTVGIGLMAYLRPTLPQAFLWGLAGGAGFALVEGLLNAASGVQMWAPVILLRVGTTLLHCFTGALMGLAWYKVLARRRWGFGLGLYATGIGVHGLWNALSVSMAFLSMDILESGTGAGSQSLAGLGVITALALLLVLILGMALGLAGLTLYVRKHSPALGAPVLEPVSPIADAAPAEGPASEQ
jgi:hypothetical protein